MPSVSRRIPAFRGTAGMAWEDALDYVIAEDARRAEIGKSSLRRDAIRESWESKIIKNLDEEYEREQITQMVGLLSMLVQISLQSTVYFVLKIIKLMTKRKHYDEKK